MSAALFDCVSAVTVASVASALFILELSGATVLGVWAPTWVPASMLARSMVNTVELFMVFPLCDARVGGLGACSLAGGGDIGRTGALEKVLGARDLLRRI